MSWFVTFLFLNKNYHYYSTATWKMSVQLDLLENKAFYLVTSQLLQRKDNPSPTPQDVPSLRGSDVVARVECQLEFLRWGQRLTVADVCRQLLVVVLLTEVLLCSEGGGGWGQLWDREGAAHNLREGSHRGEAPGGGSKTLEREGEQLMPFL